MSVGGGVLCSLFLLRILVYSFISNSIKGEGAENRTGVPSSSLCTSLLENAMIFFEFDLDIFSGTPKSVIHPHLYL